MVAKRRQRVEVVEFAELAKAAAINPHAYEEMLRWNQIREAGGNPEVIHTWAGSYRVRDKNEIYGT